MGSMDETKLRSLLQNLEQEAQSALVEDASFLEVLQALKWEIDRDARVRAARRKLQGYGLSVFASFLPRIRIGARAGETVLAASGPAPAPRGSSAGALDGLAEEAVDETLTQELRDAASAVIANSSYCRELDGIVNQAVHARANFERIASLIERAGYDLQICLDLSTYAQVRHGRRPKPQVSDRETASSEIVFQRQLSHHDQDFLRQLRIATD